MYYEYDNLSNDYYRLQHEYNIYDDENDLIHKYLFNKDTYYDENLDPNLHTGEDFCICFKKDYKKIKLNLQLHRHNRHRIGNIDLEIDDNNENYINVDYLDKNNEERINTNKNNISSNLGKITTNERDILSNLGKITTNEGDISSNLGKITTNEGNISSNSGKINNITKTIMLKNMYFTDFNSKKDEAFVKELLHFDNTPDRIRAVGIHTANMEYYFKKDDFIEIDCKLMLQHSTYEYANNIFLYYDLYDGKIDQNKLLFREIRRYNKFSLIITKDRIIAYTKLCYKVKYNINNIIFLVHITTSNKKMHLLLYHYIIQNGVNYISIKHYGKS